VMLKVSSYSNSNDEREGSKRNGYRVTFVQWR
jgi:hypothetical protein